MKVEVLVIQLCPTLCNPMDCGLPGFCVHGIFQARILEWLAIPFSMGSSWPRDRTLVSCNAGEFFIVLATREAHMSIPISQFLLPHHFAPWYPYELTRELDSNQIYLQLCCYRFIVSLLNNWNWLIAAAATMSLQSCLTLCNPTEDSPPVSLVPGILQARTLEWVAISFSNAWKWKVKVKSLSRVWLVVTPWTAAHQAPPSMGFSRREYRGGVPLTHYLRIFPRKSAWK